MSRLSTTRNRILLVTIMFVISFSFCRSTPLVNAAPPSQSDKLCKLVNIIRAHKAELYVKSGYYIIPISSTGSQGAALSWERFLELTGLPEAEVRSALAEWIGTGKLDASAQASHSELRFYDVDAKWCAPPPSGGLPAGQPTPVPAGGGLDVIATGIALAALFGFLAASRRRRVRAGGKP